MTVANEFTVTVENLSQNKMAPKGKTGRNWVTNRLTSLGMSSHGQWLLVAQMSWLPLWPSSHEWINEGNFATRLILISVKRNRSMLEKKNKWNQ